MEPHETLLFAVLVLATVTAFAIGFLGDTVLQYYKIGEDWACLESNTGPPSCEEMVLITAISRAKEARFVLKGGSVDLDVEGYEELKTATLFWSFNTSTNVLQYLMKFKDLTTYGNYENRTEFNKNNFSLHLKNVQLRDSGIYTAKIIDNKGQQRNLATYSLTVQEALTIPHVRVVLLSSTGGVCNVSVNCSAGDTWASYTCDHAHCTQEANTTSPTGVNLIVTTTNGPIQCNSSNQVDWKTTKKDVCKLGDKNPGDKPPPLPPTYIIVLIIIFIIIFIIIIITIITIIYRRKRQSGGTEMKTPCNTEYASVEAVGMQNISAKEMYETVTNAKPDRPLQVNTVYDTLGPPGDPQSKPESIYASVNKSTS